VVVGGEDTVDVRADLAGRLENLLRLHRVNGSRLLGALIHDSREKQRTAKNSKPGTDRGKEQARNGWRGVGLWADSYK
jgi:hypothetical protein